MKTSYTIQAFYIGVCLCVAIVLHPGRLHAESYPDFSKAHWEDEVKKAKAKIWRGAALGALGVASIAPTTILTLKAVEDPKRYLAYAAFSGIATLGMSFHGFFSIGYGRYQRDKAKHFAALYDTEPSQVNVEDERSYYLESRRETTRKMITFGSVLVLQSAVMLANGIVLSVQKGKGTKWGEIKSWPSYLLGGLLLPTGTFLIVSKARYMGELSRLENQTAVSRSITLVQPFFGYDADSGGYNVGLSAQISY
jgi:hypothetical protein